MMMAKLKEWVEADPVRVAKLLSRGLPIKCGPFSITYIEDLLMLVLIFLHGTLSECENSIND